METCIHCDEVAFSPLYETNDDQHERPFCCEGCLTVFNVIHEKGLSDYYVIKQNALNFKRRSPVEIKDGRFTYLDDEKFEAEFSYRNLRQERVMEFYLEGIHCLACLWLIEKLNEFVTGVTSSKLDLDKSVATVAINETGKFSQVAVELNHLGYRPHPLKKDQDTADFKLKEERTSLIRIGVAGAAAGNIMLYAVSLYGGAVGEFAQLFNTLTVLFAVPVLTYSAFPFYQNALNAIKNKTLSIDIPISLSLIVGAIMGGYNLLHGIADNYFDSLSTLVFLLLLSRYFLQKIQSKGLSANELHFFYQSDSVERLKEGSQFFEEIHPRYLAEGDVIKLRPLDFVPADGEIMRGQSMMNNSLLTGESYPVLVKEGEKVYSGTQNLGDELIVKLISSPHDSRLGKILKNVENGWGHRSEIVTMTNLVSKYFTLAVILLSAALFVYVYQTEGMEKALESAITLLIVTCPCALALAVPLTFTRALSEASKNGIIIKNDEVLEKIAKIKNVFLDKTGTITHGKLKVTAFQVLSETDNIASIVTSLEKRSKHPVALALIQHFKEVSPLEFAVTEFKEIIGHGVSGYINSKFYEIHSSGVYQDGELIARFEIEDTVRDDSRTAIRNLVDKGLHLKVLSGDRMDVVHKMASEVGLSLSDTKSGISPEDKCELIKNNPMSVMVGDGANDAIALSSADVGVAVYGAMDISLRAADVYLSTPGLVPVEKLFTLSVETMKVVRRNLVLSLLYNIVSVVLAFMGYITPLTAAIIMPVSSLTVLFSTLIGTKEMRQLWK